MSILDKEVKEISDVKNAKQNLRNSLFPLGFMILSAVVFITGMNLFRAASQKTIIIIMFIFYYALIGLAFFFWNIGT